MANNGSELFDKPSGDVYEKTLPWTTMQIDDTNGQQPLDCQKTTFKEVSISDGEEQSNLDENQPDISTVSQYTRIKIMEVLRKLYSDKAAPDYLVMMVSLSKIVNPTNAGAINLEKLMKCLNVLGFKKKETINGHTLVVEKAHLRFERYTYLSQIKNARLTQNRQIVYIDERIVDSKLEFEKVYNLKDGIPDESTVYYHAFTREGLINGLFSNQATEKEFTKWVSSILMNYLKTPSLIIMDRGPLHGILEDVNPITRYSTKSEMLKWLTDKNVPFYGNMPRPNLFELISKIRKDNKEYQIDKIFKSHGHKVLRLPSTFPDLNFSHVFWITVSDEIAKLKKTDSEITQPMIQDKIKETVFSLSKYKKKWLDIEKLLILKENEVFQIDIAIENILENCVFKK